MQILWPECSYKYPLPTHNITAFKRQTEKRIQESNFCVCLGDNAFVPPSILCLRWTITLCQKSARGCTLTPCKYSINFKLREKNDIFVPKFRCCLFSVPNLVSLSAAEGFQKESVQQLEFKKRNYFQRKTNPSFIRSGHNPSLLQLWTQLQSFPLVRQKGITFFFTTKTIKLSVRDIQGVFFSVPP